MDSQEGSMKRLISLCAFIAVFTTIFLISCNLEKCQLYEGVKDAKFEIQNIENGSVIKITADKPEIVAKIQEHCKQVIESRNTSSLLPCGKCPGAQKCWEKKDKKAE